MKNYTIEDLIYFAGFFDGEGHVSIQVHDNTCDIHFVLSSNDIDIINWIKEKFGGEIGLHNKKGNNIGTTKYKSNSDSFIWRPNIYQVKYLLIDLVPYLKVKKKQCILLLEYINKKIRFSGRNVPSWYRQWQEELSYKIRELNRGNKEVDVLSNINKDKSIFEFI